MKHVFVMIIIMGSFSFLYADNDSTNAEGEFSMLMIDDGVKVIYNSDGSNFQFDIHCRNFKQLEAKNMIFLADDILVQILPVPISAIVGNKAPNLSDSLALIYNFAYQVRDIRQTISGNFIINDSLFVFQDRIIYFWYFKMPEQKDEKKMETVSQQMFATTPVGNRVLMLSSAVIKKNDPEKVKSLLIESLGSVILSEKKIDTEKIRKELLENSENLKDKRDAKESDSN